MRLRLTTQLNDVEEAFRLTKLDVIGPRSGRFAMLAGTFGPLARKAVGLSVLTAAGQISFVLALPLLSRLYSPSDFGLFTIYLSIVNISGPIVGLKFESALFATRTRDDAGRALALTVLTMTIVTGAALAALPAFCEDIMGPVGDALRTWGFLTPFGILLSGLWSASSAWAINSEAIRTLSVARFLQPTSMTLFQLVAGFFAPSGLTLILAHLASHIGYSTFIFARTTTREAVHAFHPGQWWRVLKLANEQRRFPLYVLPAQISFLLVNNLPPVLLSSLYGTEIAGYCGVAYRIVAAPIAIVSLPLGAILTGAVSRNANVNAVQHLARKVFFANLFLVSVPVLLFSMLAPSLAGAALGERWIVTGQIIAAFALSGAAQALRAPFTEITSIFRFQKLRFAIETLSAALVFGAIGIGALEGWGVLTTIWVMSAAGAFGSLLGLALLASAFRKAA